MLKPKTPNLSMNRDFYLMLIYLRQSLESSRRHIFNYVAILHALAWPIRLFVDHLFIHTVTLSRAAIKNHDKVNFE